MCREDIFKAGLAFVDFIEALDCPLPEQHEFRILWKRDHVDEDTSDKSMACRLVRLLREVLAQWGTVSPAFTALKGKVLNRVVTWASQNVSLDLQLLSMERLPIDDANRQADMASVEDCVAYTALLIMSIWEFVLGTSENLNGLKYAEDWLLGLTYRDHRFHEFSVSDIQGRYRDFSDGNSDAGSLGGRENQPVPGQEVHEGTYHIGDPCRYCSTSAPTAMGPRVDRKTGKPIIDAMPLSRSVQGNSTAKRTISFCVDCKVALCSKKCFHKYHRYATEDRCTEEAPKKDSIFTQHLQVKKDLSRSSDPIEKALRQLPDIDGWPRRTPTPTNGPSFEIFDETAPTTEGASRTNLGDPAAGLSRRIPLGSLRSWMSGGPFDGPYRTFIPAPIPILAQANTTARMYRFPFREAAYVRETMVMA